MPLPEPCTLVRMLVDEDTDHQMVTGMRNDTRKVVSVKISHNERETFKETRLLKRMLRKGLEKRNIVSYSDTVDFSKTKALVFEELQMSLTDFCCQQKIPILQARTITQQAATALAGLADLKLIHANLTMDSIWFSDVRHHHIEIKLVDFSSAMYRKDIREEMILLSHHRAPEIILGLPITEAVDVWSLGCVLVNMLLGFNIFPEDDFEMLKVMVSLFGQPPDDILNAGTKVTHFFKQTSGIKALWLLAARWPCDD